MSGPTSVTEIVNQALDRIGYPETIGDIREGTRQARVALDVYAQTRDALLRQFIWGFAERIIAGVVASQAAPAPWAVSYTYPADCLKVRSLFNAAYIADKNDPLPILWTIGNNATDGKVIWSNAVGATLVYTSQITDPAKWEPLFVEALIDALGVAMAPNLMSQDATKLPAESLKNSEPMAEGTIG